MINVSRLRPAAAIAGLLLPAAALARPAQQAAPATARPAATSPAPAQPTPQSSVPVTRLGPFEARSFNFADRYGAHFPFQFHILDSDRVTNNDQYGGVSIARTILSGSENYLAPLGHRLDCGGNGCSRFQNAMALTLSLATHSPVQIGGMVQGLIRSYAPGDSIGVTFVNRYTGISRGTDEGAHLLRTEVTPVLDRWGGTIDSIDAPQVTPGQPRGNVGVTVTVCPGCALNASAEGAAPIINLTRPLKMGNVTRVQVYAPDPRFIVLQLDGSGAALTPSHWTNLTAAVDSRVETGSCPPAPGSNAAPRWPRGDPFRADEAGGGNATSLHCFAVGSTAGLTAGTVVVLGGDGPELETTRVVRVVDGSHFVANARMPHPGPTPPGVTPAVAGDAVTWGGLAGYAAGFNADTVAPRSMPEPERLRRGWQFAVCDFDGCNTAPLYLTPLVIASLPGNRIVLYIDFEAAGHTLNTVGLMSNQPRRPARLAARVVDGAVVSVDTLASGDFQPLEDPNVSLDVNSGQNRLPPPRITLAGCRVQPVFHPQLSSGTVTEASSAGAPRSFGGGLILDPRLDPIRRGQGCPNGDAVPLDVERHYANPLVAYPAALVYRAIRPGEQREDLNATHGYQLWMPPTGPFQVGDNVLASTWPLQFVGDIQLYARNLGFNSQRFGPVHRWIFSGQGNRQAMIDIMDQTTPYRFYSDQAHDFQPTADGGGLTFAPTGISFSGAYATIFDVKGPPRVDVSGTPGSFVDFSCYHGSSVETLCEHGTVNPFNLFTIEPALGGPANHFGEQFLIDPQKHRWQFALHAPDAVIASDATLEAPALRLGPGGCTGCTLAGESPPLGGAPLTGGQCATGTTRVAGARVGAPVAVSATNGALPGGSIKVDAAVTAPDTVSVEVCAVLASTPARVRYQVRVLP